MSILLEAEHLTKIFTQRGKNPFKAVNDVSFTLKKGETLGIVGESGSGKSTIAKLLTRLTDITEGTLKFEGKDITRLKQSQREEVYGDIQMVFRNPVGSFDPRRTLGDGIGESLRNRGMKKADVEKRVAELLEQCGLEKEYAKRYPHEVSGGQCQRAAIARALAVKPKVLICDEATSALDPNTTKSILALLKEINKNLGVTVIVITHEMAVIEAICDRVAIIDQSHIAEVGTVSEIFSEPKSQIGRQLILGDAVKHVSFGTSRQIRLIFDGRESSEPVISNLVLACKVPVNIMYASTTDVNGKAMGQMIIQLPEEEADADRVIHYLKTVKIAYEEVTSHEL